MQTNKTMPGWCCQAASLSLLLAMTAVCAVSAAPLAHANEPAETFFESLRQLCGARYEGAMTFPADGQDAFAGKLLVAEFDSCTEVEIRIPFAVGKDTSRTWIITRTETGLQLKHDHRHADGSEDEITMYGGGVLPNGTATEQSFAADAYTKKLLPEAASNVWTISLDDGGRLLTYALQRHAKPRFTAVLKRVDSPAPNPQH